MCSIFGIIDSNANTVRTAILHKIAADQLHRGPDDGGFFEDDSVAFGHRRLVAQVNSTDAVPIKAKARRE